MYTLQCLAVANDNKQFLCHVGDKSRVDHIKRMAKPTEEKQESPEYNALIEMTNDLCNALPIEDLLPKMITKRVIDFNDKSEIRSERTDRDKVQLFMSKLTGEMVSGENKRFYNFLDVMKGSSKCGFLVERMEGWISHYKFGTSPPIRAGKRVVCNSMLPV